MTFLNIALLDAGVNTFYVNITFAHAAFKASSALHGSVSTCTLCMTSACQTQEVQECGPPLPPFALLPFFFCFPLVPRDSSPNPSSLKDIRLVSSKKKKQASCPGANMQERILSLWSRALDSFAVLLFVFVILSRDMSNTVCEHITSLQEIHFAQPFWLVRITVASLHRFTTTSALRDEREF